MHYIRSISVSSIPFALLAADLFGLRFRGWQLEHFFLREFSIRLAPSTSLGRLDLLQFPLDHLAIPAHIYFWHHLESLANPSPPYPSAPLRYTYWSHPAHRLSMIFYKVTSLLSCCISTSPSFSLTSLSLTSALSIIVLRSFLALRRGTSSFLLPVSW